MPLHLLVKWEVAKDGDSWNLYPLYHLFPCSDFVSQMWGWFGGGGGVMFFSHFMLFPTFLEKNSGNTNQLFLEMFSSCFFCMLGATNGRWFLQIVDIP